MRRELTALNTALPGLDWLQISDRKSGAIKLAALDALPEQRNLRALKQACVARWGTVALIEMLKEAALRTGALRAFAGVGTRGSLPELVGTQATQASELGGRAVAGRQVWACVGTRVLGRKRGQHRSLAARRLAHPSAIGAVALVWRMLVRTVTNKGARGSRASG